MSLHDDNTLRARFRDKLAALLEARHLPVKHIFVGGSGTLTVTLYGEETARKVAALITPFADIRHVGPGYDPGIATEVRAAIRKGVRVWRVHATIGA